VTQRPLRKRHPEWPPATPEDVALDAHRVLTYADEARQPGLSGDELAAIESRHDFRFSTVHRAFLTFGVPDGPGWVRWRSRRDVAARLRAPVDGVVADVLEHDFWPLTWGPRPDRDAARADAARALLRRVPPLVPLRGARYLPGGLTRPTVPVLSVLRTDVVPYADDLVAFVAKEFSESAPATAERPPWARPPRRVPVRFWSDLVLVSPPPGWPSD